MSNDNSLNNVTDFVNAVANGWWLYAHPDTAKQLSDLLNKEVFTNEFITRGICIAINPNTLGFIERSLRGEKETSKT